MEGIAEESSLPSTIFEVQDDVYHTPICPIRRFQKKKYPIECLLLPAVEQEFGHGTDAVLEAVCPQYS
jgi:hypothetical protein